MNLIIIYLSFASVFVFYAKISGVEIFEKNIVFFFFKEIFLLSNLMWDRIGSWCNSILCNHKFRKISLLHNHNIYKKQIFISFTYFIVLRYSSEVSSSRKLEKNIDSFTAYVLLENWNQNLGREFKKKITLPENVEPPIKKVSFWSGVHFFK